MARSETAKSSKSARSGKAAKTNAAKAAADGERTAAPKKAGPPTHHADNKRGPGQTGFVRLTRAGVLEAQPVWVNANNVVLVEPTLAVPGLSPPGDAGATVHLMGQPTWPLFVKESVDAVLSGLART